MCSIEWRKPWPFTCAGVSGRPLHRVDEAIERVAHADLVRGEQEDGDREHREDDEVKRAIDRDDSQHDAVTQRLAAQRQLDLLARRQRLARGTRRRRQRQPRVAAHAAVPAHTVLLAHDHRVLGPELRDIGAEELVPGHAAREQLPVKARPETVGPLGSRRRLHRRDARRGVGGGAGRTRRSPHSRRRLRRRVRRAAARRARRDDRQPRELHALHAAPARSGVGNARAAPHGRAAPRHVPARRAAPRRRGRRRSRGAHRDGRDRATASASCAVSELVVALGAVPRTVPVPGLADHALSFKSLPDAINLRNHVLRELEAADAEDDEAARRDAPVLRLRRRRLRRRRGARGALRSRRRRAAATTRACARRRAAGCSSTQRRRSCPEIPRRLGEYAARELTERGVEIHVGTTLASLTDREAVLGDGTRIPTRTLVWTAGVRANPLLARARAAARRARPRRGRRVPARPRARRRLGARRLRARPEHAQRGARPADVPARAAPGAAAREEHRRRPAAVRLPHARPGRDARPLQGHRRRARACASAASSAGS